MLSAFCLLLHPGQLGMYGKTYQAYATETMDNLAALPVLAHLLQKSVIVSDSQGWSKGGTTLRSISEMSSAAGPSIMKVMKPYRARPDAGLGFDVGVTAPWTQPQVEVTAAAEMEVAA